MTQLMWHEVPAKTRDRGHASQLGSSTRLTAVDHASGRG
jgi:hypothetical protein